MRDNATTSEHALGFSLARRTSRSLRAPAALRLAALFRLSYFKIGEKEDGRDQIAEIVQLYGRFAQGETSKIFDNADFGYSRVTVERPVRLRYQMTVEDKARFLYACPHLLDDVQAIDQATGREPDRDWNRAWVRIQDLLHKRKSRWKATLWSGMRSSGYRWRSSSSWRPRDGPAQPHRRIDTPRAQHLQNPGRVEIAATRREGKRLLAARRRGHGELFGSHVAERNLAEVALIRRASRQRF